MGVGFRVRVTGDKETIRRLRRAGVDLKDLSAEMDETGGYLKREYGGPLFETAGQTIGERWRELSEPYKLYKRRRWPGAGILQASGRMQGAFRVQSGRDFVFLDNPTKYLVYHDSPAPRRKLPRRVIYKLADAQKRVIVDTFERGVQKKMRRAFGGTM